MPKSPVCRQDAVPPCKRHRRTRTEYFPYFSVFQGSCVALNTLPIPGRHLANYSSPLHHSPVHLHSKGRHHAGCQGSARWAGSVRQRWQEDAGKATNPCEIYSDSRRCRRNGWILSPSSPYPSSPQRDRSRRGYALHGC